MDNLKSQLVALAECVSADKIQAAYDFNFRNPRYRYLCLYGAGMVGISTLNAYRLCGIRIDYFCESDGSPKVGTVIAGVACISLTQLEAIRDETLVIISCGDAWTVFNLLRDRGIPHINYVSEFQVCQLEQIKALSLTHLRSSLEQLSDILADEQSLDVAYTVLKSMFTYNFDFENIHRINSPDQYLPYDIVKLRGDECFVDVGAFDGDTVEKFVQFADKSGGYRHIYAIEMDSRNFAMLEQNTRKYRCVSCYNYGLLDRRLDITYNAGESSSFISSFGSGESVKGIPMDELLEGKPVTFIKMDIEGAEKDALRGAGKIIRTHRPKCAICVYHAPNHIWEIPAILKEYVPEYKLFMRHHTDLLLETVCYATID